MTTQRRVPRFKERAQTLLNTYAWPDGFTVTVDLFSTIPDAWVEGPLTEHGTARVRVGLSAYDLQSADPARVVPLAIKRFRAQARDPRYTEQSRRDDQAAAELLEGVEV